MDLLSPCSTSYLDIDFFLASFVVMEELNQMQSDLYTSNAEVAKLKSKVADTEGVASLNFHRAVHAESRSENLMKLVGELRTQTATTGVVHAGEVADLRREARAELRNKVNTILDRVERDTGKAYRRMT